MIISAVIFDLNGTILEDEDEYGRAFKKVLENLGVKDVPEYPHTRGIGVKENWPGLIKKYNVETDKTPEELAVLTQAEYLKQVSGVAVRDGFDDFTDNLKESGAKIALATSNTWEITEKVLEKINLQGYFDEITTEEEVFLSKPDPEIFTLTADKLGAEREECLVIEDSVAGVTAAKNAGMKVVAIVGENQNENDFSEADLIVESFSEITPKAIDEL